MQNVKQFITGISTKVVFFLALGVAVIFVTASPCFADDDEDSIYINQQKYNDMIVEYSTLDIPHTVDEAETIVKAAATEYTTTDIYQLLYNNLHYTGNGLSSSQNIQRIEKYLALINGNINGAGTAIANITIRDMIDELLNGNSDWTLATGPLQYLASQFDTIYDGDTYVPFKDIIASICLRNIEQADSLNMIDINTNAINSSISTSNGHLSNINTKLSTVNTKLNNIDSKLQSIVFQNIGEYFGATLVSDSSHITSNTLFQANTEIEFDYRLSTYNMGCWKVTLPIRANQTSDDYNISIQDITLYINGTEYTTYKDKMYTLPNENGVDVYLFDIMPWSTSSNTVYSFIVKSDRSAYVYPNNGAIQFLSVNDYGYSFLRTALAITEIQQGVANPAKIEAEKKNQEIIDETYDDFTGDGSAAAKLSDTKAAKNASSTLRNGFSSGYSSSDAFEVFNNRSSLWGWFSQDNYNMINGESTRKGSETPLYDENMRLIQQGGNGLW